MFSGGSSAHNEWNDLAVRVVLEIIKYIEPRDCTPNSFMKFHIAGIACIMWPKQEGHSSSLKT